MNDLKIKPQFTSVPFKASSPHGITEYNGIAKFSPAGIVLEFHSVTLGMVNGEVQEVRVALDEILSIKFRKGVYKFFSQIQLRLNNFAKISQLPNHDGKVKLNIKREDYELAQKAVEQITQYMNENSPSALPSENDLDEQLPPTRVSVNELFDTEKLENGDARRTAKLEKHTKD